MMSELLQIKKIRERNALAEIKKKRAALEQATRCLEDERQKLSQYSVWRKSQEKRLYDNVIGETVRLMTFEDIKLEIAMLREQEVQLEQALQQAKVKHEEAEKAFKEVKNAYQKAMKTVEKYTELSARELQNTVLAREYRNEVEMEDFLKLTSTNQSLITG